MSMVAASSPLSLFSGRPLRFLAAGVLLVNGLFPALWILFTSLKTEGELTLKPITWAPHHPTLANYVTAFSDQPLHLFLFNSVMVALLSTALTLFVSVLAAYALARVRMPGKRLAGFYVLATQMLPPVGIIIPYFLVLRNIGWIDTYQGMILIYLSFSLPFAIWLMVSYFEEIPLEMEEAAYLDGASRLRTLCASSSRRRGAASPSPSSSSS